MRSHTDKNIYAQINKTHMLTPAQYNNAPLKFKAGDIIIGKNNSKSAQVLTEDGKQITLCFGTASEPVEAPFGLSVFNSDVPTSVDRVSLDLRATPEMAERVKKIDEHILAFMESNMKKYFGNGISKDKVREYFRLTVKIDESGKYAPLIKTKLSKSRVKVWTPTKEVGSVDDIRPHSQMCVALLVRSLYFQSKG